LGGVSGALIAGLDRAIAAPEPLAFPLARVRVSFLYPPSEHFAENPDGWWSWPGNEFDAEGRQVEFTQALADAASGCGVNLITDPASIGSAEQAAALIAELGDDPPDALLMFMFYNGSLGVADRLIEAAEKLGLPVIFCIPIGVKHGPIAHYRRPGVCFVQSKDVLGPAIRGLRMVGARKAMASARLLSITEADEPRVGVEGFWGTTVKVLPFAYYANRFRKARFDGEARRFVDSYLENASEVRGITGQSLRNAAKAHLALRQLLAEEQAHGLTMNCLRRGMLKPCMSFSALNSTLVPAACENDFPAMYTQLLGQRITGRGGFQHNPCYDTERNTYYASHCTCPTKLHGPDEEPLPYLMRRFAHTNEGSCAIQVFWQPGDPVTMVRYYPGEEPALDVYAGEVVESQAMPPAGGCTTNVSVRLTDRDDACAVRGHHNLLFCGDFADDFRTFAQLYGMKVLEPYDPPGEPMR
jgi:hypothetical protein